MIQYFDLRLKGLLFLCGLWVSVFFFFWCSVLTSSWVLCYGHFIKHRLSFHAKTNQFAGGKHPAGAQISIG